MLPLKMRSPCIVDFPIAFGIIAVVILNLENGGCKIKRQVLSTFLAAVLIACLALPLQAGAAAQEPKSIASGETVYSAVGWGSSQSFKITAPVSGDLIVNLKTPSAVYIRVSDSDGNVLPPYDYQEQTEYGTHAGHDSMGYYLSYGISSSTDVAHAIFCYKASKGDYTIYLSAKYGTDSPFEMTVTAPEGFSDVGQGDYFAEPVKWAVEKGITTGTSATTFSPNETCTTAQILTFLWRANGSPAPTISNPFSDVAAGDYYRDAAVWAYEKGLVSGSAFGGDTPATRAATVTYLWKLAGSPDVSAASFSDVAETADYAAAVAWAVKEGVTSGTGADTFSPDEACTRGQIVTFLYRAYI